MLDDTESLLKWFAANAGQYGLDPDNDSLRPWIVAAADCAAEAGENPGGLFVFLIRDIAKRDYSKLAGRRYDAAKIRLRNCHHRDHDEPRQLWETFQAIATEKGVLSPVRSQPV